LEFPSLIGCNYFKNINFQNISCNSSDENGPEWLATISRDLHYTVCDLNIILIVKCTHLGDFPKFGHKYMQVE